ncbi:AAA family ATPase [Wenjunlia tyrosinilytica]|uniref:Nuclease SbcCD subunit C n=1 Tax=Wenjunlia tyrosinilytica TaxID=1544741 RepID=A0A918DU41_9ACTN|nr:SMC family ATPase [Wenjunlia tyrosinilytica]GGO83915.1 nuclease SbcCD subunit C [Wenjunlia tyrosinilytica]
MRLHRLEVTAFGPFAGTERIDFDALATGGLFLLHGPTGAGKTSILDAVCFALYGSVPGARQGNPLRSDHAAVAVRTEVVLDLTVGGRRLEITRRPAYMRPKRTGSGLTQEKAGTLLREWKAGPGPGWSPVSANHQEIGAEITRLLGMSREQFCQVVLLPQGDFAKFLRGDAGERAAVLGRLFDTSRFSEVEKWLAGRRRASEAQARAAVDEVLHTIHRLHQAAGTADAAPTADSFASWPELVEDCLVGAAVRRADARERLTHARIALAEAETQHRRAARGLERAQSLADRQTRHARAQEHARGLESATEELAGLAERLERAREAASVAPLLELARSARHEYEQAAARESAARRALDDRGLAVSGAGELAEAENRIRQELVRLEGAAADEQAYARGRAERERVQADVDDAQARRDEASGWLEDWPDRQAEAARRLEDARAAGHRTTQLADQLGTVRGQRDAAREAGRLDAELADATERRRAARDRAADARAQWLDVRERRLNGMAAELAEHLEDGMPCEVCGSTEHPRPASPAPDRVTSDDEAAAENAFRELELAHEAAGDTLRRLAERSAAAKAASGGASAAELEHLAERLAQEHATAQEQAASAVAARQHMEWLEAEHAKRLAVQREAGELVAARTARIEDLDRERRRLAAVLEQARGADPSISARTARLGAVADRYAAAAETARTTAEARDRAEQARARSLAAAHDSGFDAPADVSAALLDDGARRDLQRRLDDHRAALGAARAALADPELAAAAAEARVDAGAAQSELESATARLRTATASATAARTRCDEVDAISAKLAVQARQVAPLLERHATARRLADLASGGSDNALRMRLESYVLAARLEQVAAAASIRLERMSGGRYTLVHSDERASGTKRSGLGLQVVDAWTGTTRDTATLSGGESFFASLALALGLADVVAHESGGIRLDTLFIDEGFGSLDPHTLDNVLDVLDTLRERDRTVGIVSHVPELRQRIPTQLSVTRGRRGSTARVTVPTG